MTLVKCYHPMPPENQIFLNVIVKINLNSVTYNMQYHNNKSEIS